MTENKKEGGVHVDSDKIRDDIAPMGTHPCCPHCGTSFTVGLGLAGGGFGPYHFCETCQRVIEKDGEPPEEEPRCDCGHLFEVCSHPNCW